MTGSDGLLEELVLLLKSHSGLDTVADDASRQADLDLSYWLALMQLRKSRGKAEGCSHQLGNQAARLCGRLYVVTFPWCLRIEQHRYDDKTLSFSLAEIDVVILFDAMSLSPTPPAFSRSLEAFKRQLSPREAEAFEFATFEEVRKAIDNIQNEQAHRRGYRNLNKIRPFLDFLQQYARVIEQFVSAKPDFLAFIWVSRTYNISL